MISFSLWSRLACSFIAPKSGLGVCKYARFNFWISAISRLSTSTRSRIPPSIKVDYIFVQRDSELLEWLRPDISFVPWGESARVQVGRFIGLRSMEGFGPYSRESKKENRLNRYEF